MLVTDVGDPMSLCKVTSPTSRASTNIAFWHIIIFDVGNGDSDVDDIVMLVTL